MAQTNLTLGVLILGLMDGRHRSLLLGYLKRTFVARSWPTLLSLSQITLWPRFVEFRSHRVFLDSTIFIKSRELAFPHLVGNVAHQELLQLNGRFDWFELVVYLIVLSRDSRFRVDPLLVVERGKHLEWRVVEACLRWRFQEPLPMTPLGQYSAALGLLAGFYILCVSSR